MTTIAGQLPRPFTLEPKKFFDRQGAVINLTGQPIRFIPAWLSHLPGVERIIVSYNPFGQSIDFEKGFSHEVIVESFGNNWVDCPKNLHPRQIVCETDFTSRKYLERFPQQPEEFFF